MGTKIKNNWNEEWAIIKAKAETKSKNYYFSNHGRLKSVDKVTETETLLRGSIMIQGYQQINLTLVGNVRQGFYVHQLVGKEFVAKEHDKQEFLIHIDRDKLNNHFENLKWLSREELTAHQIKLGLFDARNRKDHSRYKMNPSSVRALKQQLRRGKTKKRILAKNFGITVEQLRKIEKGIDWKHITLDD